MKTKSFQQKILEQLDIQIKKEKESRHRAYTVHRNELKIIHMLNETVKLLRQPAMNSMTDEVIISDVNSYDTRLGT